jgi:Uma2 family endonuclease
MASESQTLISVEEYRATVYEPDCDYVDGKLEERNVGEKKHSRLQMKIAAWLYSHYEASGFVVFPEMRVQVKPGRYRVPDICVTIGDPPEDVFTTPPFLCVEILSPEDRMSRVETRINDYLQMGVPYVWVLDPQTRQAFIATAQDGLREVKTGHLRTETTVIEMPLAEVFG